MTCPSEFIALAHGLAEAGGEVVRRYFRTPVAVDDKADDSPVTIADRQAEEAMRSLITTAFPDHGIIGEEHGREREEADYVWVLDPIDGTKSFITGMPFFGILISLLYQGRPILGIIDQPISRERWLGAAGHPTTFNGEPVKTRPCPTLESASLYATGPEIFEGSDQAAFARLEKAVKLRRFGADCYAYGLLALGFVDVVCEAQLQLYDYAALVPVIEGAGGIVTDWEGAALDRKAMNQRILAAGDKRAHAQALSRLAGE